MRLIDADALKAKLSNEWNYDLAPVIFNQFETLIDNAPTVQQINILCENADEKAIADMKEELQKVIGDIRPQGKWTIGHTAKQKKVAACNLCNCFSLQGKTNFCPNCGADMRKGGVK